MKNFKMLFIFLVLLLSVTSCIYEDYGHTSYRRNYPSGPRPRGPRLDGHYNNRGPHGRNPHR